MLDLNETNIIQNSAPKAKFPAVIFHDSAHVNATRHKACGGQPDQIRQGRPAGGRQKYSTGLRLEHIRQYPKYWMVMVIHS